MTRDRAKQFSEEVERHRRSLLYFARACDWEAFKKRAGSLFDYVETVEFRELERRFFRIFYSILASLVAGVLLLVNVDFHVAEELRRLKPALILGSLCISSFELFFYFDYRMYVVTRLQYARKRREGFIRDLERDFRGYARANDSRQAAA